MSWMTPRKFAAIRKYNSATAPSVPSRHSAMRTMFVAITQPSADPAAKTASI